MGKGNRIQLAVNMVGEIGNKKIGGIGLIVLPLRSISGFLGVLAVTL